MALQYVSVEKSSLECAGRHAHRSPECGHEVRWRRESGTVGYVRNGLPWFLQQRDPSFESAQNDVPMRRNTRLLLERTDEMVDAQAGGAGQLVQCGRRGRRVVQRSSDHVIDTSAKRGICITSLEKIAFR